MELFVILAFAWLAVMLGDLAYWSVASLARRMPAFVAAVAAAFVAHQLGATVFQTFSISAASYMIVRYFSRRLLHEA